MAGVRLTITTNADRAGQALRTFFVKASDTSKLMKNIGEIALTSVQENFELGGRPKWPALAAATIKRKGHDKPLIQVGTLKNISRKVTPNSVIVGVQPAAKDYAAIHQFGGKAGRGRKVNIPARPYMILQQEDLTEIEELVNRHVEVAAK